MTKGIIIYAIGHRNYFEMAYTLAASLRLAEPEIKIALITDKPLNNEYFFFDHVIPIPEEYYMQDGKIVFNNAMMHMYELSPFDMTIKLDADMIWLYQRKPSELFVKLKDTCLQFETTGYGWNEGNSVWVDEKDIKKAYRLKEEHRLYKIFGEFLYFKKSKTAEKFFAAAKQIYANPKVECAAFANGNMTDELAYQIAVMKTGIYPRYSPFTPVFNEFLGYKNDLFLYPYQLAKKYYALSIGGNFTHKNLKDNYNNLARHCFAKLDLQRPYQVKDKRSFLPERIKL